IGDYVYKFYGYNSSGAVNTLARAPLSSPTTWTSYTGVLPGPANYGAVPLVVGNYIYIFGGYSTVALNTIYRAALNSDLTVASNWSSAGVIPQGVQLPAVVSD